MCDIKMNEYFKNLKKLGRRIDNDIQKLEKTWETPRLMMTGYGENVEEANEHVESIISDVKKMQNQLIKDRTSWTKFISAIDEELASINDLHQAMDQQCQDIETLLSECGYEPQSDSLECNSTSMMESETESSILAPEQIENSFLSPGSFNHIEKASDTFEMHQSRPKSIATPVIKCLATVQASEKFTGSNVSSNYGNAKHDLYSPY